MQNSFRVVANSEGAKAIVRIKVNNTPLLLSSDTFSDRLTKESLQELYINCYSSSITRTILPLETTLPKCENIPYIATAAVKTTNTLEFYIFSRYQGFKSQYRELLSTFASDTQTDKNLKLLDKLINSTQLQQSDLQDIRTHPITLLETKIEEEYQSKYKIDQSLQPTQLLFKELESNQGYIIITELLDTKYSTEAYSATLTANLYRAIEDMVSIKTDELTEPEQQLYNEINHSLPQAYYYAFCGQNEPSTTLIRELNTKISKFLSQDEIVNRAFDIFYTKLFSTLKNALQMYQNNQHYFNKEKLETLIKDCGATIELATLLQEGIRGGRYLYLINNS